MHGIYYLAIILPFYYVIAYFITLEAIARPYTHDIIYLQHDGAHIMIIFLVILDICLCLLSKPKYDLLLKRLSLMCVLKCISQTLTVVPQPLGPDECKEMHIWQLKSCADMMFSGHTCFTYLVLYKTRFRYFFTFAMAFELVLGDWHYMSDCFIAAIVGYAIEKYLPDESYL